MEKLIQETLKQVTQNVVEKQKKFEIEFAETSKRINEVQKQMESWSPKLIRK